MHIEKFLMGGKLAPDTLEDTWHYLEAFLPLKISPWRAVGFAT